METLECSFQFNPDDDKTPVRPTSSSRKYADSDEEEYSAKKQALVLLVFQQEEGYLTNIEQASPDMDYPAKKTRPAEGTRTSSFRNLLLW